MRASTNDPIISVTLGSLASRWEMLKYTTMSYDSPPVVSAVNVGSGSLRSPRFTMDLAPYMQPFFPVFLC